MPVRTTLACRKFSAARDCWLIQSSADMARVAIVIAVVLIGIVPRVAAQSPDAGSRPEAAQSSSGTSIRDRKQLLSILRARRDEVKRARADERVDKGRDLPLGFLVGMSRKELLRVLGPFGPDDFCTDGQPVRCEGAFRGLNLAFYHLKAGWVGGGTLLFVTFDGAGRCDYAAWSGSK